MVLVDVLAGLVIAIGLAGVVIPVLPGNWLIAAAVLGWSLFAHARVGWITLSVVLALVAVGAVVKYAVPGRRLQRLGVPTRTLLAGAVVGIVGFFVIPVVGLPVGFIAGVYLAELARLHDSRAAWPSTVHALRAVGLAIGVELLFGLAAATAWLVGALTL